MDAPQKYLNPIRELSRVVGFEPRPMLHLLPGSEKLFWPVNALSSFG